MSRSGTLTRLERLDRLESRLKADEPMHVAGLAAEFGISPRTLHRDIALLRERGVPVEADRGRGGGIRLYRHWGVGRLRLDYREAVDLLVSIAIAEQLQAPWMLANLAPVRRKLAASFAPALRPRIESLKSRIMIGPGASVPVLAGFEGLEPSVGETLFGAFFDQRILHFSYRDAEGKESRRAVEPQILMLNYPVWYLMAWDQGREAVRSFRCDRMRAAEMDQTGFALRPRAVFDAALRGTGAVTP